MLELAVFKEPRGVMRCLQFIFSICAFATITGYSKVLSIACPKTDTFLIEYPFYINISIPNKPPLIQDYASDARFFVATGVISLILCILVLVLYTFLDDVYKNNERVPLIDFGITVIVAILWLLASAAWINGVLGVKHSTDSKIVSTHFNCVVHQISYTSLNISIIFGFLNVFLWTSGLWFVYKETTLFRQRTDPKTPDI